MDADKHWRAIVPGALVLLSLFQPAPCPAQTAGFEEPPVLAAKDRVAPEVLNGPHHRLDDRVVNDGFMNHFVVHSDFGDFAASSERMVATRVREVYAVARLRELSQTDAFSSALENAATVPVDAVTQVIDEPVETVKGIPGGVARNVRGLYYSGRKTAHQAGTELREDETSDQAKGGSAADQAKAAAKDYVGYTSAYRELAKSLDVDPYTSNPVLRSELTRLARAAFAAGLGFKMVVPVPRAVGLVGKASDLVWDQPPEELERLNNLALKDMGVDQDTRLEFFASAALTPTTQTMIVEHLKRLDALPGRAAAVELAATATDEQEAWFLTEVIGMLASYHARAAPLAKLVVAGNDELGRLLVGVSAAGHGVIPVPFDHVTWQPGMEREGPLQKLGRRELWITGTVSPRAESELERRGFEVHTGARAHFDRLESQAGVAR